ncbi:glucose-repressible alcohol dehydrogenase transcriptional effector [Rhizophagus clarus]|uniref:poly(A)-specific ribonuclease n=1 Tax=Rhizophagus clarus TaxID=94130 RepID=A0A8H3LF05_9GLOM|nr:glucose-repressible alcohol dehydrogenase transcriptional effector [Rhizophagus clarus]
MNSFPHQLIYQQNGSPNGPVSPVHSPTHTPSPPTTSPGQTSPLSYPVSHGVPAIYSGGNMLFSFQSKLQPKMQSPLNHAFAPHSLLNSGPPGQSLMQQPNITVPQTHTLPVTNTPHWQSQLNYYAICRNSNSPHHHARQAAAAARNSNLGNPGSSAIAITDPNNPNKPPLNGVLSKKEKEVNGEKQDQPFQQWMTIDLGGMGLKNISKELFQYDFLTTLYINHNNLTYISPEISKLRNLTLLDISGNKLSVIPPELGMLTSLRELLLFDNLLVNIPFELGTLYQLETLGLEGNVGLNDAIKSILQKDGTASVIQFLRDNCQVPPRPIERDWIMLENEAGGDRDTFTLLCYNILCEKYATTQLYGYTPLWALDWDYRKELIVSEVLSYNADIVCLQEVDTSQYDEYFKDTFHNHGGYDSVYWPKSRAKTMADWEKKSVDGCATFYKSSKYQLIDKQLIEFNQVALQRPDFKKTDDMFNRVITKDNIAVITLLENKETLSRVIVVNCHIHWDPTYADVKLVQVAMLMDELDKLAQKWCTNNSPYNYTSPQKISTIICGDFNSTPDSGVYEFLTRGIIRQDHDDFGDHSTNTLSVTGLLGGIDKEYLTKMVGFPNAHFPSDHVVILAEFRVKPPQPIPQQPQFGLSSNGLQRRFNGSQLGSRRYGCNNG